MELEHSCNVLQNDKTYLKMKPVASMHKSSIQEHLFKVIIVLPVLLLPDPSVMEVGDTHVLRVSTDIDNLATTGENLWGKH